MASDIRRFLGETVTVTVDRPIGSVHPHCPETVYPENYGYIEGVLAGDGEEQDAYVLGVDTPVASFTGQVIGIIRRDDDNEDKLIVVPHGRIFCQNEIAEALFFQERFFVSEISCMHRKSAGMIVYRREGSEIQYLLLLQEKSLTWSLPKGHVEPFETEVEAAVREVGEEGGLSLTPHPEFRREISYTIVDGNTKTLVLFLAQLQGEVRIREGEIREYCFANRQESCRLLRHQEYEAVLLEAEAYMEK